MKLKEKYKRLLLPLALLFATAPSAVSQQVTLQQCIDAAEANYPLIRQYDIIGQTRDISLSDINRNWLPKIELYGQGSVQNSVAEFPSVLTDMLDKMGQHFRGLGKFQYRAGVDVSQTIWDGGASRYRREQERVTADVNRAALDVELYALRARVENLYFGILLMQEQTEQTRQTETLLDANLRRMTAAFNNGVATRSDVDMIEAELLGIRQQILMAQGAEDSYRDVLSVFTGLDLAGKTLERPSAEEPSDLTPDRPELRLYDARLRASEVMRRSVEAEVMPKIGFFGQAFYGYPGFDNFRSMSTRRPDFNLLAGIKATWNISSLYTRNNRRATADLAALEATTQRETFLFNNRLAATGQDADIRSLRAAMANDAKIIELRRSVRRSAESQLENGVIDATALLSKITDENRAELMARYHEIELLKKIYELKNTLNR